MDNNERPTQAKKILEYMKKHGSITPWEAIREFSCLRLGARIFELKKRGYDIKTEIITTTNSDGETVRYAKYFLKEEIKQRKIKRLMRCF